MATSPNYAWAEPDNSSLVKNGASDIRTLGDAIDTSVWNVGYGQAGKNKIINGDFRIWQRGTSFTQADSYTADRWQNTFGGATPTAATSSQQTFTPGAAPVAGYESSNFLRMVTTTIGSCTAAGFQQLVEDVRTFAGQTITVSFWAKADSARTVTLITRQNFGSGGSTATFVEIGTATLTTSWARYSVTYSVPSVSGKTIGAGSYLAIGIRMTTVANGGTLDLWGVQAEYGSKATPFQTASGGSPQAELAMCQRYYYRLTPTAVTRVGAGYVNSTTGAQILIDYPVQMRIAPTALEQSGTATDYSVANSTITACNIVPAFTSASVKSAQTLLEVASGLTTGQAIQARLVNTNAFLGWSAEL